jgi:predicted transposase/invertase (TIGR01784 family)
MQTTKTLRATRPATRLNPLNDFFFLKIMGEKGDEDQLLAFLNAVLEQTGRKRLVSVKILESRILTAEAIGDKTSILDVLARLPDGTRVNIEVQVCNQKNMDKRSLFYWSKEYIKGIKAGQDYIDLPGIIAINIIDFDFLDTNNYHTVFHLREAKEPALVLTEVLEIHFINMVKWRRGVKDIAGDPLHRWLAWLDRNSPPELIEEVTMIDSAIKKAHDRHTHLSNDKEARILYEMREKSRIERNSDKKSAMREGMAKGLLKGRNEGRTETNRENARKMKAIGIPAEHISAVTGLSFEAIGKL